MLGKEDMTQCGDRGWTSQRWEDPGGKSSAGAFMSMQGHFDKHTGLPLKMAMPSPAFTEQLCQGVCPAPWLSFFLWKGL